VQEQKEVWGRMEMMCEEEESNYARERKQDKTIE
jgi:hypothetical protein